MKKKLTAITLFMCVTLLYATAQVSVVLFPSAAKQFYVDDLWKTTFINTSTSPVSVYVQFQISTQNIPNIVTINTSVTNFSPGANHITATEGAGGKWSYGSNEQASILQATGKLPYGTYILCARVFAVAGNKSLGVNCNEDIEVAPMLPPQLASPADKDTITLNNPLLTWIPPRPVNGLNITYALVLTKVDGKETPAQALLQNPPILNLNNLNSTNLPYPVTAPALEAGVNYAWQVSASYEGYSLGVTDVWTFTLKPPPPPPSEAIIYPVANKISDGHFYVTRGIFRFAYNNKANDKKLKYAIKRIDKKESLKDIPELTISPGTNKIEIDMRKSPGLKKDQYYELLITDSKGQAYKLMFYYVPN